VRFILITSQSNMLLKSYFASASLLSVHFFREFAFHVSSFMMIVLVLSKISCRNFTFFIPRSSAIFGTMSALLILPGLLSSTPAKLVLSKSIYPNNKTAAKHRQTASISSSVNISAFIVLSTPGSLSPSPRKPSISCFSGKSPPVFR